MIVLLTLRKSFLDWRLTFAVEEDFTYYQISAFLTLLHTLLLNCRG